MKKYRDLTIIIVLFGLLIIFTIVGPGRSHDEPSSPLPTTHSSGAGGAMALYQWLNGMGYTARQLQYREFTLDRKTDLLFILNPSTSINRTQTQEVLNWVERGGTLVFTASTPEIFFSGNTLLQEMSIKIERYAGGGIDLAPVLQPVFRAPPITEVLAQTNYLLSTSRADAVPLIGPPVVDTTNPQLVSSPPSPLSDEPVDYIRNTRAVLFGIPHGNGFIYVSSATYPFTNSGLQEEANAALVLNMLGRVPEKGTILFDEYHHGYFRPPSLRSLFISTAWGQAVLYGLVVLAGYFVVTGRRFGRPIQLREEVARRSSAEYVESMADLFRRSRKREVILQHYRTTYKRRIAKSFGINPLLDNERFVAELMVAQTNAPHSLPPIDPAHVLTFLDRFRKHPISEQELLTVVLDMDKELEHC